MATKSGKYVITTVQLRPEQQEEVAALVWDHVIPSVSALVRDLIDDYLRKRADRKEQPTEAQDE